MRHAVISFDIDLTIRLDEDHPDDKSLLDASEITRLKSCGYYVGICSDRTLSDQMATMRELGVQPDFFIEKDYLRTLRNNTPAKRHVHIGDDDQRDRDIAVAAGWEHIYPWDYNPEEFQACLDS